MRPLSIDLSHCDDEHLTRGDSTRGVFNETVCRTCQFSE